MSKKIFAILFFSLFSIIFLTDLVSFTYAANACNKIGIDCTDTSVCQVGDACQNVVCYKASTFSLTPQKGKCLYNPSGDIQNLRVTSKTATSLNVAWDSMIPSGVKGVPVTYTLEYKRDSDGKKGDKEFKDISQTQVILTNLVPNTSYTIDVTWKTPVNQSDTPTSFTESTPDTANGSCTLTVSPTTGTVGKTSFTITGKGNFIGKVNTSKDAKAVALSEVNVFVTYTDENGKKDAEQDKPGKAQIRGDGEEKTFSLSWGTANKAGTYSILVLPTDINARAATNTLCSSPGFTVALATPDDPNAPTPNPTACEPSGYHMDNDIEVCDDPRCVRERVTGKTDVVCKLKAASSSPVNEAKSCDQWDCNGVSCNVFNGGTYCLITSEEGKPKQCSCGIPPTPPPPPCAIRDAQTGLCQSVNTAIGAIQTTPVGLAKTLFGIILSLSGGIAVLLIITTGYQIMTSEGNPEKIQSAKDTLTSTMIGLVFMIFSLVILQIIGVDILHIPGLTK